MAIRKINDQLPAALRAHILFEGQVMSSKELIDILILKRSYFNKEDIKRKTNIVYRISSSTGKGKKIIFASKAEKQYIDDLLNRIEEGQKIELEHLDTIQKIKKSNVNISDAAKMIAADHIAEDRDYYKKLKEAKLENGGPITDIKPGAVLDGPSHADGGIQVQVDGKPVVEAQGGEAVINAEATEKNCEKLSEINQSAGNGVAFDCDKNSENDTVLEHGGKIYDNSQQEMELFNKILREEFGSLFNSIHEINGALINHPNDRTWVVELNKDATIDSLTPRVKNFETRLHVNAMGQVDHEIESLTIIPAENNEFYILIPKNINPNFYLEDRNEFAKGGKICPVGTEIQTLIFEKPTWDIPFAKHWAEKHDFMYGIVDEKPNSIRIRQRDPSYFVEDSFRTIDITDGVKAVIGCPIETAARGKKLDIPNSSNPYDINKNIEALIDQKGDSSQAYSFEEKLMLRKYSGYGGIKDERLSIEDSKKSLNEYYTPDEIIKKMWALAYKFGYKGGPVLEPSAGTGEFLKYVPNNATADGYEINKYSLSICKILYPQFTFSGDFFEQIFIKNRDSIKGRIADIKKYDLVIGNPPYGDFTGLYAGMGEKQYTNAHNYTEYFITRGLDLLNADGLLIYIVGVEVANGGVPFLQQGSTKAKVKIAEKADLLDAYRLPNGVFERTDVVTDILVFKKK